MTDRWGEVLGEWPSAPSSEALRAYSDAVNLALLERWLPSGRIGTALKTDLFDEAVAPGLFPLLRDRADAIVAVDVSPAVIAAARARYADLDARLGDVRSLPVDDASVDVVVSNSTLDHLSTRDEVAAALAELRRVLVSGGRLIVTVDNAVNPLVALRNALPSPALRRLRLIPHRMGLALGPRALADLLAAARFDVLDTTTVMHVPRVLVRALAHSAPRAPLLSALRRFEAAAKLPTGPLTGQFVAALARR